MLLPLLHHCRYAPLPPVRLRPVRLEKAEAARNSQGTYCCPVYVTQARWTLSTLLILLLLLLLILLLLLLLVSFFYYWIWSRWGEVDTVGHSTNFIFYIWLPSR